MGYYTELLSSNYMYHRVDCLLAYSVKLTMISGEQITGTSLNYASPGKSEKL